MVGVVSTLFFADKAKKDKQPSNRVVGCGRLNHHSPIPLSNHLLPLLHQLFFIECGYHTYHSLLKALQSKSFRRGKLILIEVPRGYHTLPQLTTLTSEDKKTQAKVSL